jgi:uncharacterized membrane protein
LTEEAEAIVEERTIPTEIATNLFEAKKIYPPREIAEKLWALRHTLTVAYGRIPSFDIDRVKSQIDAILITYSMGIPSTRYSYEDLVNELQLTFLLDIILLQAEEGWAKMTELTGREPSVIAKTGPKESFLARLLKWRR